MWKKLIKIYAIQLNLIHDNKWILFIKKGHNLKQPFFINNKIHYWLTLVLLKIPGSSSGAFEFEFNSF